MNKLTLLGICALTFLTSCASSPPTAQERMSTVLSTYEEADKQLASAEKDLASFEKNVFSLRETASKAKNMRTKAAYDSTLARLGSSLRQTHLDLQALKATNQSGRAEYQRQINQAATEIENSSDENQAQ